MLCKIPVHVFQIACRIWSAVTFACTSLMLTGLNTGTFECCLLPQGPNSLAAGGERQMEHAAHPPRPSFLVHVFQIALKIWSAVTFACTSLMLTGLECRYL
jgi:hypothetical protein